MEHWSVGRRDRLNWSARGQEKKCLSNSQYIPKLFDHFFPILHYSNTPAKDRVIKTPF